MKACPGCKDPKCGDDQRYSYQGIEVLSCKLIEDNKCYHINIQRHKMTDPKATLAAEEYAIYYNNLSKGPDWDLVEDFDKAHLEAEKFSCDGCPQNLSALKHAFNAGIEWANKHPSREMVERIVRLSQGMSSYGGDEQRSIDEIMDELNKGKE